MYNSRQRTIVTTVFFFTFLTTKQTIITPLRSQLAGNKCLDIPNGNTANNTQLQIWDCQAGNLNQQFNKDGNRFRARLNSHQVMDAYGENNGAAIGMWNSNDTNQQKWRAGLN